MASITKYSPKSCQNEPKSCQKEPKTCNGQGQNMLERWAQNKEHARL